MSRFLFVVPPLAGHINPAVPVAQELSARGHDVAWAGDGPYLRQRLPREAHVFPVGRTFSEEALGELRRKGDSSRWVGRLRFVWDEFFTPLARGMLPGVEAAIEEFAPAALVVDQHAVAGALAARRRGLPWATSAAVWLPISGYLEQVPAARDWLDAQLEALQHDAGLEPVSPPDLSPELVLVYTTRAFVGSEPPLPPHFRFVGPCLQGRPETADFPWDALSDSRRVLVSLGTVHADVGARFYETALAALGGGSEQAIVVAPDGLLPRPPENVIVRPYVPHLALLPHVDAVVCHGGFTTVSEVLAHGLPLVVAPIKDDHMLNAHNVARTGAGIRVKFARVQVPELREAVSRILDDLSYRRAAGHIAESFRAAGGAVAAAGALEQLVRDHRREPATKARRSR